MSMEYNDFGLASSQQFDSMQHAYNGLCSKVTPEEFGRRMTAVSVTSVGETDVIVGLRQNLTKALAYARYFHGNRRAGNCHGAGQIEVPRLQALIDGFNALYPSEQKEEFKLIREQVASNCVVLRAALGAQLDIISNLFELYALQQNSDAKGKLADMLNEAISIAKSLTEKVCAFRVRLF